MKQQFMTFKCENYLYNASDDLEEKRVLKCNKNIEVIVICMRTVKIDWLI